VNNNEHLLTLQIEQLKAQVEQLEKQLEYVKAMKLGSSSN
jgi:hypothetical protein